MELKDNNLAETAGIYLFKNKKREVIYIGKAVNLKKRVKSYFQKELLETKTLRMVGEIKEIKIIKTESEFEAFLLEAKLIKKYQPKYNTRWRDDKHPLYIKITKEKFPKVFTVRQEDDKKSAYFGPFPSASLVRETLRFLRKIFPYCMNKRIGKKACFYSHLNLCRPCPNFIVKNSPQKQKKLKKEYLKNIKNLKNILNGKSRNVLRQLKEEMGRKAAKMEFEEAEILKRRMAKLEYLTQPRISISDYLKNPNLYEDQRKKELSELEKIVKTRKIKRIEGYDVSNILGKEASGAMVVFLDGEAEKNQYRRFRIKLKQRPNDTVMIKEILTRRLKHQDWEYPHLMVIDGGKGQVSAALEILEKFTLKIPVLGLTKRLEEVILLQKSGFKTLRLEENSPALQLLKRIRDEAHRFARKYHLFLRKKSMLYSR